MKEPKLIEYLVAWHEYTECDTIRRWTTVQARNRREAVQRAVNCGAPVGHHKSFFVGRYTEVLTTGAKVQFAKVPK